MVSPAPTPAHNPLRVPCISHTSFLSAIEPGIQIAAFGISRFVDLLDGLRLDALLLLGHNRLRGKFFLVDLFRQNLAVVFGFVFQYDLTNQQPLRTVGFGLVGVEIPEFRIDRHAQTFHRAAALFGNAEHRGDSPLQVPCTCKKRRKRMFSSDSVDFSVDFFASTVASTAHFRQVRIKKKSTDNC